jgi:hypothetical protein
MRRPGPPAPLPVRQHEFEGAIHRRPGLGGTVNEGENLGRGLGGDRRREQRIAGERIWLRAGQLGEDERPGRVAVAAGQVEAAQARRPAGNY